MSTEKKGNFWDRLKDERRRLGLTQDQMAEVGGVSKGSQVGYESGARPPTLTYLDRLLDAEVDVMFVLSGRRLDDVALDRFDWELHDKILETIEIWLQESKRALPFEKKMELLRLFVNHFSKAKTVDLPFIHQTLKLAA